MAEPRKLRVGAGRVDDDEIELVLKIGKRIGEFARLFFGGRIQRFEMGTLHNMTLRHWNIGTRAVGEGRAVFQLSRQRALAAVEIDGGDRLAQPRQRHGDMHRGGGLARSALFVPEDDDMRSHPGAILYQIPSEPPPASNDALPPAAVVFTV